MPYNGVGVFSRIYSWVVDAAASLDIMAQRMDTDTDDIADGLTNCITRDGQSTWLANLPAGGFKLTGLGTGSADGDSTNYGQVFKNPVFTAPRALASPPSGDSSTLLATTAFVVNQALSGVLPGQPGTATPAYLRTISNVPSWGDNGVTGAPIASMATINLSTATGDLVHITGTNPITAITIPDGAERTVVFDDALTLTYNASTLILPTLANITTAAGDTATIRGDGAAARVVDYQRANGNPLVLPPQPGLKLLAVKTPTAAATVDFLTDFSSAYDNYLIVVDGLLPAATDALVMRLAVAGAAISTSTYFGGPPDGTAITSATAFSPISSFNVDTNGKGMSAKITVCNVNDLVNDKQILSTSICQSNTSPVQYGSRAINTQFVNANAVTGIRFLWQGGANFKATGKIRVYGITN